MFEQGHVIFSASPASLSFGPSFLSDFILAQSGPGLFAGWLGGGGERSRLSLPLSFSIICLLQLF